MLQKLKQIYPSIIPFQKEKPEQYQWFKTIQGEIFGIHQHDLTKKDQQLLQTFCSKYEPSLPKRGMKEQVWYERIFENSPVHSEIAIRFIYFQLPANQITPIDFQSAFGTLFAEALPILWESETEGIMIEEIRQTEEEIHFDQIINILMADLSVSISILIGPTLVHSTTISDDYDSMLEMGRNVFTHSKQKVVNYMHAVPYLLVQRLSDFERDRLSNAILKSCKTNPEMLFTLQMYFKHDLNISETAKHLHMHRNSLQYRLDKFTKETGIRVQSFPEALVVQLALLATNGLTEGP